MTSVVPLNGAAMAATDAQQFSKDLDKKIWTAADTDEDTEKIFSTFHARK